MPTFLIEYGLTIEKICKYFAFLQWGHKISLPKPDKVDLGGPDAISQKLGRALIMYIPPPPHPPTCGCL